MILVSVDDHVVEPPDMFANHVPAAYRDRAPRVVRKADGSDVWVFEGNQMPNIGLNAVAGRPPEQYGVEPTCFDQLRKGCYDVDARIGDMNANGVLASMCFPTFPSFCGQLWRNTADKDLALAMARAYNDWHIDEWCGSHPGRFIPLAVPPIWDPELMADEVRRVAKKGCHAISFTENPEVLKLPSLHDPHWDPVWKACSDEGTIICIHIGSGAGMSFTSMDAPVNVMITVQPTDLKIALSEGGTGWIPHFLERADFVYKQHKAWTHQDFGDRLPSDVFREHVVTCFIDDPIGIQLRHKIGIDSITWECDYPHSDTTWPNSPEALSKAFEGVPDEDINKITHENALRHFRLDPFVHRTREQSTVAALRAEATDVDLTLKEHGGKRPNQDETRPITAGDIVSQLSNVYSTPAE
jgi:predicted TIM-barrel fold metal-dependent hydrolase